LRSPDEPGGEIQRGWHLEAVQQWEHHVHEIAGAVVEGDDHGRFGASPGEGVQGVAESQDAVEWRATTDSS
jgi:hypothetical protein